VLEPERQLIATNMKREESRPKVPADREAPLALVGLVLSQSGEPLPNMRIEIERSPVIDTEQTLPGQRHSPPQPPGARIKRTAVTPLDGSYRIVALPPGRYTVSVFNNDFEDRKPIEQFEVQVEKTPMKRDFRVSRLRPAGMQ
jgi:protocatechuate 3,4-dioxygenase beta subunit